MTIFLATWLTFDLFSLNFQNIRGVTPLPRPISTSLVRICVYYSYNARLKLLQGLYEFWKVMEFENATFQDVESCERGFLKMAMEKFCMFGLEKF